MDHFKNKITLDEIAAVAHLSTNHFCRYFKLHTRKTYFEFLTEIRIGNACKLLIQKQFSINSICYESGFSNSSHFNRCFRHITGKTPFQYKKEYMKEFE
jgi:AraC-like DNA-binding protein